MLAEQEGRRSMTLLTMLTFLPNFIKFYLVGGATSRQGGADQSAEQRTMHGITG